MICELYYRYHGYTISYKAKQSWLLRFPFQGIQKMMRMGSHYFSKYTFKIKAEKLTTFSFIYMCLRYAITAKWVKIL